MRGYVHVLIEHQSSPDRHMAFRLMRYAVATMQRHLDSGHKRLPLVIPCCLQWQTQPISLYNAGWTSLMTRHWPRHSTVVNFRWSM